MKKAKLVSDICTNSYWPARFLAGDREACQCSFKCKVEVIVKGHKYVVTEKEYRKLKVLTPAQPGQN